MAMPDLGLLALELPLRWIVTERVLTEWDGGDDDGYRHLGNLSTTNRAPDFTLAVGHDPSKNSLLIAFHVCLKLRPSTSAKPKHMFFVVPAEAMDVERDGDALDVEVENASDVPDPALSELRDAGLVEPGAQRIIKVRFHLKNPGHVIMPQASVGRPVKGTPLRLLQNLRSLSTVLSFDAYMRFNTYAQVGLARANQTLRQRRPSTPTIDVKSMFKGLGAINVWHQYALEAASEPEPELDRKEKPGPASTEREPSAPPPPYSGPRPTIDLPKSHELPPPTPAPLPPTEPLSPTPPPTVPALQPSPEFFPPTPPPVLIPRSLASSPIPAPSPTEKISSRATSVVSDTSAFSATTPPAPPPAAAAAAPAPPSRKRRASSSPRVSTTHHHHHHRSAISARAAAATAPALLTSPHHHHLDRSNSRSSSASDATTTARLTATLAQWLEWAWTWLPRAHDAFRPQLLALGRAARRGDLAAFAEVRAGCSAGLMFAVADGGGGGGCGGSASKVEEEEEEGGEEGVGGARRGGRCRKRDLEEEVRDVVRWINEVHPAADMCLEMDLLRMAEAARGEDGGPGGGVFDRWRAVCVAKACVELQRGEV